MNKIITINKKDILYDVNFISWKTAKCRIVEAEARAEAQTDEEGRAWFERQLDTAIKHIKGKLKWCLIDSDTSKADNAIGDKESQYILNFSFSPNWKGDFGTLSNNIHRYVVDYILYEWFKMTLPSEMEVYLASSISWEDKVINEARNEEVKNVFFRL